MRFPLVVCIFVCLTVITVPLRAQSPNGNINGLVSDPSGAAVAGAEVVAVNDDTHVPYTTKTNAEGIYVLANLPPGPYGVQVSKIGFKTLVKRDVTLNIQDSLSINFTVLVGAFHEIVTVQGGAPLVNTESAAVSTVIDQNYVKNMPLNGRSFQDLILLTPGIVTQTPQASEQSATTGLGMTGEFSVNGQRPESNYYTVDGVSANVGVAAGQNVFLGSSAGGSLAASTALGTTQGLVSVDDLQEFRVESSTYSAEYGRNPGGQFSFETKSGTNQWHGTAYDYLRNGFFDASDWFNNYYGLSEPTLQQNDFGGTFGGPVRIPGLYNGKDKTFFFVSYEGLRLNAPQAATVNFVPDLCMRGGGRCPAGRNPAPNALQQALNVFPIPNGQGFADGIAEYIASWSTPNSLDSTSIRFDHTANDRLRLRFRFSDTDSNSTNRGEYLAGGSANSSTPSVVKTSSYTLRTYTAAVSSIFSSGLSNELRLNYSSNEVTGRQVISAFGGSAPLDLVQLLGLPSGSAVTVGLFYDGYNISLQQQQQSGAQRQWNLVDTASLSLGRHVFKFGVDYRRLAPIATVSPVVVPYFYVSEAFVEQNNAYTGVQSNAPAYPLYTNFSVFAQDEWRVSQRLNLSLGLRWELNPAPSVTQGLNAYAIQGSGPSSWTLAPQGAPLWRTTWYNFAPRLGVAYALRNAQGSETVVRGGGGVFFDTGQQLGSLGFLGPGFSASTIPGFGGSFPVLAGPVPAIVNPPIAPYETVYGFAPHLQLPYTLQWNVSIEQGLGKSQVLTLSYVGAHASRLLQENTFLPTNNPNTSYIGFVENGLTSDYDSGQIQFRRRLSKGSTALASYTWSHCLDYGSQNYIIGYQRGNCDFDIRQNFSAAFSYDLPIAVHNRFLNIALRDWGLDDRFTARTAFPVTLSGNQIPQPNGQIFDEGLNIVAGQPIYLYGANCALVLQGLGDLSAGQGCPGGRAINPNAFVNVNSGLGDAPRNFIRLFGAWQMDLAVRRELPIREGLRLQFRMETFNVFNHPNFGAVSGQFGTGTFGQSTATLASSLGVLNPLYQTGGPRSVQFAFKLMF